MPAFDVPAMQALARVPSSVLEPRCGDWLPLFLQYAAAKPGGRQTDPVAVQAPADEMAEEAVDPLRVGDRHQLGEGERLQSELAVMLSCSQC